MSAFIGGHFIYGGIILWFLLFFLVFFAFFCSYLSKKYANPYTLTFLFGKKGAGKSCWMVAEMIRYLRNGYIVYTDMHDIFIKGVRIIDSSDLSRFRPQPGSVIFLDEVGISFDNRNFKTFPPGLRDFFKFLRKNRCICVMNSQAYDVDKKIRDTTDSMALVISLIGCISLYRPIKRSITLVDATGSTDSRIADNLRFCSIFSWRFLWMPKYFKYFNSLEMPSRDFLPYREVVNGSTVDPDLKSVIGGVFFELRKRVRNYIRSR